ncbi:MAG: tyrosine-type recombinase/integrase [Bacteroidales bacterium]
MGERRKDLEAYLEGKYSRQTVKIYRYIQRYLQYMGPQRAGKATYRDVMEYMDYLRKHYPNPATINRMLYAVKAFHFYLVAAGKRADHPCRALKLKDVRAGDIQLQDLFTSIEMEKLLQRKERYPAAALRNRTVISLLIYQGLRLTEITRIRLEDIDLDCGTIYIRATIKTTARTLTLRPNQVMLLHDYINKVRPGLLKTDTDHLVVTLRGTAETGEGISYLVETFRPLFPDRILNTRTIRQSVITNLLKEGKDLRVVQVFAGHKKISTTERYHQSGLEELQAAIEKHHPLG